MCILTLAAYGTGSEPETGRSYALPAVPWQWQSVTNQDRNETTTLPNPEKCTRQFNDERSFKGTADGNAIGGTSSQEGGFSINLVPTVLAWSGAATLDPVCRDLLSIIAASRPERSDGLALETIGREQCMLFNR